MREKKVTILVESEDGTKQSKVISFKEYIKLLDKGENPQTVGMVPDIPGSWAVKKPKDPYDME